MILRKSFWALSVIARGGFVTTNWLCVRRFLVLITLPAGFNVIAIANVVGKEIPAVKIFAGISRYLSVDIIVLILIMSVSMMYLSIPMAAR